MAEPEAAANAGSSVLTVKSSKLADALEASRPKSPSTAIALKIVPRTACPFSVMLTAEPLIARPSL
ncbi:hypothetical protein D3C83_247750 [compost metagenome]